MPNTLISDAPTQQKIHDQWIDQNDPTRTGEEKYLAKNELFEAAVIHVQRTGETRVFRKMERMLLKHLEQSTHTHTLQDGHNCQVRVWRKQRTESRLLD